MKRKPKKKRTKCAGCPNNDRKICLLLPTVHPDTEKPDGGKAYFCRDCQNR